MVINQGYSEKTLSAFSQFPMPVKQAGIYKKTLQ